MDGTALFVTVASIFIAQMKNTALNVGNYAVKNFLPMCDPPDGAVRIFAASSMSFNNYWELGK